MSLISVLALFAALYVLYLFVKVLSVTEDEYNRYRNDGLSGGFTKTLFGDNKVNREGAVNGISMKNGNLIKKASYSPEHAKRLFTK